jgi:hypothetical protein
MTAIKIVSGRLKRSIETQCLTVELNGTNHDLEVCVTDGKVTDVYRVGNNTHLAIDWEVWKAINDLIRKIFEK